MHTFLTGFSISLSLILAIGAQNAFVLKQGLKGQYVLTVVLICAFSDAILISLGVSGFHVLLLQWPWLEVAARFGGAIFLLFYGSLSFYSALSQSHGLTPANEKSVLPLSKVVLICLGFTWLNPHVYLDTLVLMGSISSQYAGQKLAFSTGAVSASFIFFFALGYGAKFLRPVFVKPNAWKVLEFLIGIVMWSIALSLLI
ncbi:MAG: amino acid transporter [Gammaproteobacteria bacterium]|jgi:L-lysine exporter family protein LysE/ArgO|nr:amino acid transporter [Gammaproteobacteria bacterium]MBT3722515.1 amino acid transporter [Gammaproteobacteria bacterium]MBT4078714.1 amino acid transporter [Gammaproteobacteria bacterium]MBT4196763.1 amino acid transporter [Gammaproteobacteria bacterium]MBT4450817.1 amino acid transporter [Gammaproteobacteria bacterium]